MSGREARRKDKRRREEGKEDMEVKKWQGRKMMRRSDGNKTNKDQRKDSEKKRQAQKSC